MAMTELDPNKAGATAAATTAKKKLKIGIIGCGWIADAHVNTYLKLADQVEIVAAADIIPGKAQAFINKFEALRGKVRFYNSDREMIDAEKDLDAVSICTYNCQHAPCAIYALEHGVNVLLEKPLCVTFDEAKAIQAAEQKSGKILSIGFQPRFAENMIMIRKIVQSGILGDIYYVQTGGGRRAGIPTPFGTSFIAKETGGIGALGDIGCYSLDLVLHALGDPKPVTVTGFTSDHFGTDPEYYASRGNNPEYAKAFGVDDFAAGFIRLENGIVIDFRIAWAMNFDTPGDTLFYGTKGGLRVPSTDCWNGTLNKPMTLYYTVAGQGVQTEIPLLPEKNDMWVMKAQSFINAINNGTKSPVPIDEIIANQAILSGIAESAKLGHEIEIKW